MIEELVKPYKNSMRCLCLHLDAKAKNGDNWNEIIMSHIDGAINIYKDDAIKSRCLSHISKPDVNATYRTHLFRAENVPINALPTISELFFHSQALWRCWISDQFDVKFSFCI